ncbi:hypothetical protein [Amycolatopsis sp.]|uniref:phosphotransferase-like protein n=1 Tax=Amycolatopsis sp. TaxID=37632 RepID=UPI0034589FE1
MPAALRRGARISTARRSPALSLLRQWSDRERSPGFGRRYSVCGNPFRVLVRCHYCGAVMTEMIVLNGGSSSGKSGIARCLQAVLPDPVPSHSPVLATRHKKCTNAEV